MIKVERRKGRWSPRTRPEDAQGVAGQAESLDEGDARAVFISVGVFAARDRLPWLIIGKVRPSH
jgi:hypothetical protein